MPGKNLKNRLSGAKVAILGFGVESQETVGFLLKHKAQVTVFDEKEESAFDTERIKHLKNKGVHFQFGAFGSLAKYNLIVRSPGVKPGIKSLQEACDIGIKVTSATNLFFENAKGITIGITGTKGKGTTAALLYEIAKSSGQDVYLGGNIGTPALSFVEKLTGNSISILELSSFQLMDITHSPNIAIVLMVTQDHLDYHTDKQEYIEAKAGIVQYQTPSDFVVVNYDYPASLTIAEKSAGEKIFVSRSRPVAHGCYVNNGNITLALDGKKETIIAAKDIMLAGKHNLENVCAAIAAAKILNLTDDAIIKNLKTFKGLAHRLELVREINGVRYYNDSIGTTPDSAIAAINAFDEPKILILGGSSKGSDFTELGKVISESSSIKTIIGIGKEWHRIKSQISPTGRSASGGTNPKLRITNYELRIYEGIKTMRGIVEKCSKVAKPGDIVMLSPACASFDMFKDYKDRGNQFKEEVKKL